MNQEDKMSLLDGRIVFENDVGKLNVILFSLQVNIPIHPLHDIPEDRI